MFQGEELGEEKTRLRGKGGSKVFAEENEGTSVELSCWNNLGMHTTSVAAGDYVSNKG